MMRNQEALCVIPCFAHISIFVQFQLQSCVCMMHYPFVDWWVLDQTALVEIQPMYTLGLLILSALVLHMTTRGMKLC